MDQFRLAKKDGSKRIWRRASAWAPTRFQNSTWRTISPWRTDDSGRSPSSHCCTATGVRAVQVHEEERRGQYLLTLTNDLPSAQTVEIELPLEARAIKGGRLVKRDGWMLWRVRVPANGTAQLRYRIA